MKIAICDDEQIFRDQIKACISGVGQEYTASEYICGDDLVNSNEEFDIIFLDIDMPGITGIETAEKLRENGAESEIIFLTSHVEFVYEAFKVRAFRFLEKPVDEEKFTEAFQNALKNCEKEKLIVEYRGHVTEIYVENVAYMESSGDGTFIYDKKGTYTQSRIPLKEWEGRLKDHFFFRIHKTYLVSMRYVSTFDTNSLKLIGYEEEFPIARRSSGGFRQAYMDFIKDNARMM